MKKRNGFVSNSSTSSFCIYGVSLDKNWEDILISMKKNSPKKFKIFKEEIINECNGKEWIIEIKKWFNDMENEDIEFPEILYDLEPLYILGKLIDEGNKNAYTSQEPYNYDAIYIGKEWSTIGDNETGAEFKRKIEKQLKDWLGDDIECDTHEVAWND